MNNETDHKSGDGVPCQYPSTHSANFVRRVAQGEGRIYPGTLAPPSEPHPEPTRNAVSKDIKETAYNEETAYNDDTENIIDPASGEITTFEAALKARYERLSLLTLDLATEAGESVRELPYGERRKEPKRFDRGIASMTKAIWAHRAIEKLRTGKAVSTEDLAGLLPGLSHPPSHHLSTHSADFVRGVAQDQGLVFCATDAISSHPATSQETQSPIPELHPELHPEPTRSIVSKDGGEKLCNENIETKKQKNEIEQTALTPQTRKTEATSNIIQPTGELCGLSATGTGDHTALVATHTDKTSLPFREAGAHPYEIPIDADPARSPP